jgi:hypothetical protein
MTPEEATLAFSEAELPVTGFVSTGSFGLDKALGTNGWPIGAISIIFGETMTGKTSLAMATTARMQALGTVAYVNLALDFNPVFARHCGVDLDNLIVLNWMPGPSIPVDLLVVDAMYGAEHEEQVQSFHDWTGATVVAVSQVRTNLHPGGTVNTPGYLDDAPVRVKLSTVQFTQYAAIVANVTRNPWSPERTECWFKVGPYGIDRDHEIFRYACRNRLIRAVGGWYSLEGESLGQGEKAALRSLQRRTGALQRLEAQLDQLTRTTTA